MGSPSDCSAPFRRQLPAKGAAVAALLIGAGALIGSATPAVQAAPDPCAASEIAKTAGSVATDTGTYLDTHPQTNRALSMIIGRGGPQSLPSLKSYLEANPLVAADLQRLQRPLANVAAQCQLPISFPQMLGMMQANVLGTEGAATLGPDQAAAEPAPAPQPSPAAALLPAERPPTAAMGSGGLPGPAPAASPR